MMVGKQKITPRSVVSFWLLLGLIVGGIVGGYIYNKHHQGTKIIPSDIKKQLSFIVFYPSPNASAVVNQKSFKYDAQSKLLSYVLGYDGKQLTVAEQPTPQNFVDIPPAYEKLIESLNEYNSFDSYYDKVSLTHPKEFKGQQSAVMNSKGTLLFVHPTDGDLNLDQWKKLFNGLEVIR